jgi:transcriptional regulator with XRE-family HTH domain
MTVKKVPPTLVDQLREAIQKSGQSFRRLGAAARVDPSRISRFVRGQRSIDVAAASALCEVLGYQLVKVAPPEPRGSESGSKKARTANVTGAGAGASKR